MAQNNDDVSFFETLYDHLRENDEEEYIIGGDFNTVINSNLDEFGGIKDIHKNVEIRYMQVLTVLI